MKGLIDHLGIMSELYLDMVPYINLVLTSLFVGSLSMSSFLETPFRGVTFKGEHESCFIPLHNS